MVSVLLALLDIKQYDDYILSGNNADITNLNRRFYMYELLPVQSGFFRSTIFDGLERLVPTIAGPFSDASVRSRNIDEESRELFFSMPGIPTEDIKITQKENIITITSTIFPPYYKGPNNTKPEMTTYTTIYPVSKDEIVETIEHSNGVLKFTLKTIVPEEKKVKILTIS